MEKVIEINNLWLNALTKPNDEEDPFIFYKVDLNHECIYEIDCYLFEIFTKSKENVFDLNLYLIENCFDYKEKKKGSCAFYIATYFCKWLEKAELNKKKTNNHLIESCNDDICFCMLTPETSIKALEISTRHHTHLFSLFAKCYKLSEITNKEFVEKIILDRLATFDYSEKAITLGELQLQDKCDLETIVVPLLVQDRCGDIEAYVNKNDACLIKLMDLLNKLCDFNFHLKNYSKSYENIPNKKMDKFKAKNVSKFAISLLKRLNKTNLINLYPNIQLQMRLSQLRFLVSLKYNPNNERVSEEAWMELILDIIHDDDALRVQLLIELIQYQKDTNMASTLLAQFKLVSPQLLSLLPAPITNLIENGNNSCNSNIQHDIKPKLDTYYPEELTLDRIIFVDNQDKLNNMFNDFETNKHEIIGIDSEWKPFLGIGDSVDTLISNNQSASILQISNRSYSYIFPIETFSKIMNDEILIKFLNVVLNSPNIIKLGYGFKEDASKLYSSFKNHSTLFQSFSESVINIDEAVKAFEVSWKLFDNEINNDEKQNKKLSKGLSELTRRCFGKSLDKSERLSNWDNRPLREDQLKYAALDAYILIKIYDYIQNRCKMLNVKFDYFKKTSIDIF